MSWFKEKVTNWFFKDYITSYIKPLVDKIIKFFDGKKTILSLLAFGLAEYAKASPDGAVASIILEVLKFLSASYGITPSLDGISATAIVGLAIGAFDKLRKWSEVAN